MGTSETRVGYIQSPTREEHEKTTLVPEGGAEFNIPGNLVPLRHPPRALWGTVLPGRSGISGFWNIREIKLAVTWSYVKQQTAKMTSEFVFFSSNPSLNHIKIEKCLLLFATNTNIFTLQFKELKTDG